MCKILKKTLFALSIVFICATSFSQNSSANDNSIVAIIKSPPMHFNNALTASTQTIGIATQLFASPLRYDKDWNPLPYLAKSWSFTNNNKTLTLNLEENATFHDGKQITAEDVVFSIQTIKENHPFTTMFAPVSSLKALDKHTVEINLAHQHPAILLALSPPLCPILPKHIYGDGQNIKTHPANINVVGSGPFKINEVKTGEYVILDKYEDFFIDGRPYLDRVVFRFIKDPSGRLLSMTNGDAQVFPLIENTHNLKRMQKDNKLSITSEGYDGISAVNLLEFNTTKAPFNDVRVRKAIAHAINRDFIMNKLHSGLSQPITGPIIPSSPFYEPNVTTYEFDMKKANQILDDAGYTKNKDGIRFDVTLDYEPGLPEQQKLVAEFIKGQFKQIGVNVLLQASPDWGTWAERVSNWNHDMTLSIIFNWGDPVIGTHRSYLSSNIRKGVAYSNMSSYKNQEVDRLLNAAAKEMDLEKRKALYSEFQKIVCDEIPIIQLNMIPYNTVYDKNLSNIVTSIWGSLSPMDQVKK